MFRIAGMFLALGLISSGACQPQVIEVENTVVVTRVATQIPTHAPTNNILPTDAPPPTDTEVPKVMYQPCGDAAPPNLSVGQTAVVKWDAVNIRSAPEVPADPSANIVTEVHEGDKFPVVGGPQCVYGGYWWLVRIDSGNGWIREASSKGVYISPANVGVPTQVPTRVPPTLRPTVRPTLTATDAPVQSAGQQLMCIERTIDAAHVYSGELLDFSEALEAWAQASAVLEANREDDENWDDASDALYDLLATIATSRVTVMNTEVPNCLLNFKGEWPDFIDLMNYVTDFQESLLELMDSIDECYERNDHACAKAVFPSKIQAVHSSMDNITDFADCERSPECIHAKALQQ